MPSPGQSRRGYRPLSDEEEGRTPGEDWSLYGQERRRGKKLQLTVALLVTATLCGLLVAAIIYVAQEHAGGEEGPAQYRHAAVASDATQCSTIGKTILQQGGNAVDAAIAALFCDGLTSAHSMGIGGGFFMTIYNSSTGEATIIDARETAPAAATQDMFKGNASLSESGPLSIAVPGEVRGYWLAHSKYGQLPWKQLVEPAIKMAAEGFPVPHALEEAIWEQGGDLATETGMSPILINKATGSLYREGEMMIRPELAKTLQVIADEGAEALYDGSLTEAVIQDLEDLGSIITRQDLKNYKVLEKAPVEVTLSGGLRIISPPPPSSGAVLSFMLNVLDGYNLTEADIATEDAKTLIYHRIIETFKFAYAKRTFLADENFVDVKEVMKNLTSTAYANHIRSLITDDATHGVFYYGPKYSSPKNPGTAHLSVLDQYGNAVSVTSTVNGRFGARRRGNRTGIIFNNEMDDFSSPGFPNDYGIPPSEINYISPGKRPLSSMCPAVFVGADNQVTHVLGAAGGSRITTATAWVAVLNIWLGKNIKLAIDAPRLHNQLMPAKTSWEKGLDRAVMENLSQMGHNMSFTEPGKSIVQGIAVRHNVIYANSDYRKGGTPDGF